MMHGCIYIGRPKRKITESVVDQQLKENVDAIVVLD